MNAILGAWATRPDARVCITHQCLFFERYELRFMRLGIGILAPLPGLLMSLTALRRKA